MGEITFEDVFEDICAGIKEESQVEIVSQKFSLLKTDEERYKFVAPFLNGFNFLTTSKDNLKSEINATKLREEGNKLFAKRKDVDALDFYTESVAYAPNKSQTLALAFANRSAVLKSLGHYEDCVQDIKRALDLHYPENLEHKLLTRQGECYKNLGCRQQALSSFAAAKKKLQKSTLPAEKLREHERSLESLVRTCDEETGERGRLVQELSVPPLSHGPNSEVECASDSLQIRHSEDMGRHVVATRDIRPGDVLVVERPFAAVLLPEFVRSHCSRCLRRSPALLPCETCTLAMYCSATCREGAWQDHHVLECAATPSLLVLDMGKMALLAARILAVAGPDFLSAFLRVPREEGDARTLGFNAAGKYSSSEFSPIFHLIANTSLRSVPDLFKRALMAAAILKCLQLHSKPDSNLYGGLLLRLLQSLPCNAHEVSELCKGSTDRVAHSVEIGAAAYATLSLLNHSCDPNVVRHSHGTTAVLRAIKSVPCGGQILDNYGYHFAVHSKEVRQAHLKTQYLFTCACEACTYCWVLHKHLPNSPSLPDPSSQALGKTIKSALKEAMGGDISEEMLGQFLAYLALLDRNGGRMCQEYNCSQEAIKQFFAKAGNYHLIPN